MKLRRMLGDTQLPGYRLVAEPGRESMEHFDFTRRKGLRQTFDAPRAGV